jgi:hypothetical protein
MTAVPPSNSERKPGDGRNGLSELDDLNQILDSAGSALSVSCLCEIGPERLPIHGITLGNPDPEVAAMAFVGGVHGLERIGAQVVIAYLRSVVSRLRWDRSLHQQLERVRLVFVPLVNPGGFVRRTRANPNGIDLMRNAPVEASEKVPFLVGGQRLSRHLPWYRGPAHSPMEEEASALCRVIRDELLGHRFSIAVDCHSGFGIADRIWFPFAHTATPIPHLAEMHALMEILDQTYSHHRYVFEPQSLQYLTHGDLWDYLYRESIGQAGHTFLPLTLEMGSWLWVKKNLRQAFSSHGIFNPLVGHRQQRVLRRHVFWLEFMTRAASSYDLWLPAGAEREDHHRRALARWYAKAGS